MIWPLPRGGNNDVISPSSRGEKTLESEKNAVNWTAKGKL